MQSSAPDLSRSFRMAFSEQRFSGPFAGDPALGLEPIFQTAPDSPVVRFRYVVHAPPDATLTGDGTQLRYFSISLAGSTLCLEIQLSNFNEMLHSYTVAERAVPESAFQHSSGLVGP